MSLSLKNITLETATVTQKQFITNSLGQRFELIVHSGKLYIQSHESNGTITGGEIVLDPLPISVSYGSGGAATNPVVEVEFTTDLTELTTSVRDDIIAYYQAQYPNATIVLTTAPGSLKIIIELQFETGYDTATVQSTAAAADKLSQVTTLTGATVTVAPAVAKQKQVATKAVGLQVTPGSTGTAPTNVYDFLMPTPNNNANDLKGWREGQGRHGFSNFPCTDGTSMYMVTESALSDDSRDIQVFKLSPDGTVTSIDAIGHADVEQQSGATTNTGQYWGTWTNWYDGDLYVQVSQAEAGTVWKYPNGAGPKEVFAKTTNIHGQSSGMCNCYVDFYDGWFYYYHTNNGLKKKALADGGFPWEQSDLSGGTAVHVFNDADNKMKFFQIYNSRIYFFGPDIKANPGGGGTVQSIDLDGNNLQTDWTLGRSDDRSNTTARTLTAPSPYMPHDWWKPKPTGSFLVNADGLYIQSDGGMDFWPHGSNTREEKIPMGHASLSKDAHTADILNFYRCFVLAGTNFLCVCNKYYAGNEPEINPASSIGTQQFIVWSAAPSPPSLASIDTLGPLHAIKYKLSTDTTWLTYSGAALVDPADYTNFNVDIRIESPDGSILHESTLTYTG